MIEWTALWDIASGAHSFHQARLCVNANLHFTRLARLSLDRGRACPGIVRNSRILCEIKLGGMRVRESCSRGRSLHTLPWAVARRRTEVDSAIVLQAIQWLAEREGVFPVGEFQVAMSELPRAEISNVLRGVVETHLIQPVTFKPLVRREPGR